MKIEILSDLHFEFHRDGGRAFVEALDPSLCDVLVVAGDLSTARTLERSLQLLRDRYRDQPIVYVAGNHEFYDSSPAEVEKILRRVSESADIHWLDCTGAIIQDVRFVGATLWFDDLGGRKNYVSDFRCIRDFEPWVYRQFRAARDILQENVRAEDVVVTHYLPSYRSVAKQFEGSPLNCFFVSDLEPIIAERQPQLWVHGHTHASCDYRIGRTRVVCNPYGYTGHEVNRDFKTTIVEVKQP